MPIRAEGYQWDLYLPGTSSDVLWTEYLPPEKLPQVLNPPSGFIQNANSSPYTATVGEGNPDLDNFSITFGIEKYEINRALMMKELFVLDESISFEEFKEYKFNLQYHQDSDVAQAMEMLSDLSFKDTQLIEAQEFLANWDLGTGIENKETALGLMTMLFLSQNVEDFVGHMLARNEFSPLDVELAFTRNSSQDFEIKSNLGIETEQSSSWTTEYGSPKKFIYGKADLNGGLHKVKIQTTNGNVYINEN